MARHITDDDIPPAIYEAAMANWIDDYLDEHPEADLLEAHDAWHHAEAAFSPDFSYPPLKEART